MTLSDINSAEATPPTSIDAPLKNMSDILKAGPHSATHNGSLAGERSSVWDPAVYIRIGYGFRERIEGPEDALEVLDYRWPQQKDRNTPKPSAAAWM